MISCHLFDNINPCSAKIAVLDEKPGEKVMAFVGQPVGSVLPCSTIESGAGPSVTHVWPS
jgi:hypothetical protein